MYVERRHRTSYGARTQTGCALPVLWRCFQAGRTDKPVRALNMLRVQLPGLNRKSESALCAGRAAISPLDLDRARL